MADGLISWAGDDVGEAIVNDQAYKGAYNGEMSKPQCRAFASPSSCVAGAPVRPGHERGVRACVPPCPERAKGLVFGMQ